jgi:NHL repeat
VRPPQAQPAPARPCVPAPKAGFGCAALAAALAVLALTASPALGNSHVFKTSFGSATSTPANPYPLLKPTDVAVNLSTHDLYVADAGNHRIEKFDSAGHLLLMFGRSVNKTQVVAQAPEGQQNVCVPSVDECQPGVASATSAPGSFNAPAFIKVDNSSGPSAGDVYVADIFGKGIVTKFDGSGHLLTGWNVNGQLKRTNGINGIAVSTGGDLLVLSNQYQYHVARFSESGSPIREFVVPNFNGTEPHGLGLDGKERFFKSGNPAFPRVSEFSETELIADQVTPGPITGLVTDPLNNDLYVDEQGSFISHFKSGCGENCTPLETFGAGKLFEAAGISVDAPSDNVYVANGGEDAIAVFEAVGPYVTTGPTSSVGHTTATITGHLFDGGRGEITTCEFEYGETDNFELGSVPCEPGGPYGQEADVTANLTGLTPETTYHYRLVASNAAGSAEGAERTFKPQIVNDAKTEPAINLSNESAELVGSYSGDGTDTKYFFEFGTSTFYGRSTLEQDAGSGTGPQTLGPVAVTGLQPATTYHFRLVASNAFGTTYGQDRVFTTFARPLVGSLSSSTPTPTTAVLSAQIDPRGGETTYHFEYGPTTDYGVSAPTPDQDIGSTPGNQEVVLELSNLELRTTYHFRVVAENNFGKTVTGDQSFGFYPPSCPNATVRQETASNHLPDCRAYELVSPANAGGAALFPVGPNSAEATSPARFSFGGWLDTIPGSGDPPNTRGDLYVATRTGTGWETKYVGIPATEANAVGGPPWEPNNGESIFMGPVAGVRTNPEMSEFIDWNVTNIGTAIPAPGLYLEPLVWAADGTYLGEWPTVPGYKPGPILNQSADFSHYYFQDGGTFIGEGLEGPFEYENGTAFDNNTVTDTVSQIDFDSSKAPLDIRGVPGSSTDGSRILMSTGPCVVPTPTGCAPGEMYMRVNDSVTYDIAKSHTIKYLGMTADASKVYFTSADQLTPEDNDTSTDLYMWREATDSLTLVSVGTEGPVGNSDACNAAWTTQCGVVPFENRFFSSYQKGSMHGNGQSDTAIASNSGDIYFYSPETLDDEKGVPNEENLYVYRNGAVRYVTTLSTGSFCPTERFNYQVCSAGPVIRIQVSSDGAHMAMLTASRLTGYENAQRTEMYSYEPGTGELVCVSCGRANSAATSNVWASSNGIFMSDDGRTFFSTADPLVARDTNGLRDVYEYVEGRAQLISSGTSAIDSGNFNSGLFYAGLVGVSADGANAYFSTYETLVPQDRNGSFLKFYDARTSGGFPFTAALAPCEAADECSGSGGSPPALPSGTSAAALGNGGNWTSKKPKTRHKKRHRLKRKKHDRNKGGRGRG